MRVAGLELGKKTWYRTGIHLDVISANHLDDHYQTQYYDPVPEGWLGNNLHAAADVPLIMWPYVVK